METHESAHGNKRKNLVMPKRPTMKSSANMHWFKLTLMQAIARKGLGGASSTDKTNIDDLSEKMRPDVTGEDGLMRAYMLRDATTCCRTPRRGRSLAHGWLRRAGNQRATIQGHLGVR